MKSRKWSARHRNAQDKICRVWEERGADYARLQHKYEEAEEARQKKARQRRETEAAQVNEPPMFAAALDSILPCYLAIPCCARVERGSGREVGARLLLYRENRVRLEPENRR